MTDSDDNSTLSDEDRDLWRAYIDDMRPEEKGDDEEDDFQTLLDNAEAHEEEEVPPAPVEAPSQKPVDKASVARKNSPSSFQLDRRTEEKFRKGKMPIEGRLDLHGMSQSQAHENLNRFITGCYQRNLRCVLVITGKGKSKSSSDDWLSPASGVLKERTPHWLAQDPLKSIVLKFCSAQPKDGGSGALYVYLKRQK